MKIAICGLVKSANLGEEFIAKSLAWIIKDELQKKSIEDVDFVYVDILARKDKTNKYNNIITNYLKNYYEYKRRGIFFDGLYLKIGEFGRNRKSKFVKNVIYHIRHIIWQNTINFKTRHLKYYKSKFVGTDIIVIDGAGLLEYSYNEYQEPLNCICEYAQNLNIPVVFNAIGRAGEYDENDFRCKILKKAFSYDCVKFVSARDSAESVQECVGDKYKVELLADAAFYTELAYDIHTEKKKEYVGIGLIRDDAMLTYSKGMNREQIINLFVNIAKELEKRGYKYQFFTNGAVEDYETGLKVLKKLGIEKKQNLLTNRPMSGEELIKTISGYQGLITCRMHSSIAAFSLGIPSVILSWNKKVEKYMDIVGYPERAISQSECNAINIVDQFEKALEEGIGKDNIKRMRRLARKSVQKFIYLIEK